MNHIVIHHMERDGRRAERLPLAIPVRYRIRLPGRLLQGRGLTMNLSGGGVQFPLPFQTKVPQGSPCELELTIPDSKQPLKFKGAVMRCAARRGSASKGFEIAVTISESGSCDKRVFSKYCYFIASQLVARYLS